MNEIIACRACLAVDVALYHIDDMYTHEVYQHLTNISFQSLDGKPQLFCFECNFHMKRCKDFRDKCLRADGVLNQLLLSDLGLTQHSLALFDRNSYNLVSSCSLSQEQTVSIAPDVSQVFGELKTELLNELKVQETSIVKCEFDCDEIKVNNDCESFLQNDDDNFELKQESGSEDDLPLLSFCKITKRKKLKPTKKIKDEKGKIKKVKSSFKADYAKEITLTREEQIADLNARRTSTCYLNSLFQCTICFKGFVDQNAFDNHMQKHEKKYGQYECDICKLRYESDRQLRAHSFTVHCRKYDCIECGHRSQTAHQAKEHERWHRGYKYECDLCGQSFSKPTTHLSHLRKSHPTEFFCELCGDSFIGRQGLLLHKSKMHRHDVTTANEPEADRFCSDCNILFVTNEAWKRHIVTSVKHILAMKDSDTCRICGSRFATNTELRTHMKKHKRPRVPAITEGLVKYSCSNCHAKFADSTRLMKHMSRMHSGIKQKRYYKSMVCDVCGKKCSSNATLKYHQRTHTGEKPYPCSVCSKKFADSNQLRIHSRTHTDSRPYTCELCEKSFRQRPALNRHMRVHTGVKPYACSYCAKSFSQSNSVKLHIRSVHLKLPPNNRRKNQRALEIPIALVPNGSVNV